MNCRRCTMPSNVNQCGHVIVHLICDILWMQHEHQVFSHCFKWCSKRWTIVLDTSFRLNNDNNAEQQLKIDFHCFISLPTLTFSLPFLLFIFLSLSLPPSPSSRIKTNDEKCIAVKNVVSFMTFTSVNKRTWAYGKWNVSNSQTIKYRRHTTENRNTTISIVTTNYRKMATISSHVCCTFPAFVSFFFCLQAFIVFKALCHFGCGLHSDALCCTEFYGIHNGSHKYK